MPRHGKGANHWLVMPGTQSSLRRLRKLVCAAGHPRLVFDVAKAGMAQKVGLAEFRAIRMPQVG
jgi:hypothetical protein